MAIGRMPPDFLLRAKSHKEDWGKRPMGNDPLLLLLLLLLLLSPPAQSRRQEN